MLASYVEEAVDASVVATTCLNETKTDTATVRKYGHSEESYSRIEATTARTATVKGLVQK